MGTSLKQLTLESGATYRFRGEPITVSGTGVSVSIGTAAAERPAILDAEGLSRHFIVRAGASLTLHNVILQHGLVSGGEDGGSVHVSGQGSSLRLFGVHVRYNTAAGAGFWDKRGGGVFAGDGAAVNVSGSTFTNNSAAFGGAVCASASVLHVSGGSRFEGNSGPRGACIGLQRARREDVPAYGTVLDTVFDRCTATWYGGGVYALGSTLEMSRVQLRSCAVTWGGLNYGGGGLFAMSYQRLTTQVDLDDVTFDRCSTLREGGGIKAMRSATSTESPELRLTNVVFSACAAGDGGGMLTYICLVTLTRVDFLDCHASGAGGGLVLSGGSPAPASLSRVQFSRCVSTGDEPSGGGGLFMKDSAAAVVEDSDFTDCDATGRGGAIASVPQPDNVLTCTRVTFLRCHSAWGGALAFFGVLSLHDSHALQCHAKFCGAFRLSAPLVFSMVGGSIQGCYATEHDLSYAGALYAYVGTQATLTNVEVADCYSTRGAAIMSAGKSLVLRGCNLLRLGSGNTAAWSGALEVVAGARSLEVEDTLIAGSTPGAGPPSPPGAGCIHVGGGSTTLRNVTLSRCSHGSDAVSAALRVGNDAAIVGALVHVVTSCAAPPMQPLLQAYGAAANTSRALALRHLRISADGCNLPAASTLLGVGTTIATCAQLRDVADASCGTSATCTDGAVFGSGGPLPLASAECSCTGSAFARLTDESSAELLPYGFGCFTQRVASSVSVLGVTAQSVSFRLAKSAVADQMQTQTLRIAMEGTDLRMGAAWEVSSTPAWLSVPKATGALNETDEYAQFAVSATTAGQAGRGEPYEATLNVSTVSGLSRSFAVPVLLYVSAATVEAVWGVVNAGGSCANTSAPVTSLVVGASVRVSFVGCDRDGLKNALRTDGFAANATTPDGTSVGVEIEFDEVSGAYAVLFSSTQPGTYSLRLRLAGQPVATPIALVVEGCPDGEVPNPDDPTKPCKPCLGSSWALEGDLTCGRCREGFYHVGGGQNEGSGQCLQCPVGGICEAASTITDILMDIGWWRLTNFTVDIRRCDLFDDTAKTPCRGGVVDSLCAQGEGNLHGPLCALCDPPGADDLGYWYKPESGTCARCPEPSGRVITIVMVIFAVLAIVGLLAFVYHRPPSGLASTSAWLHRTARLLEPLGLWPKWKQLISFFQVLFSLASVYRTKLPRQFYDALAWLNWITFDIFDIYPADCVGSVADRLLLVAIGPLVFVAVVVACSAFVGLFAGSVRKWVAYGCSAGLVIVWALTPPVSQMILQSYDCETFGVIDDTNSTLDELGESVHLIEDVQYMHSAMRVTCGSPEHERITALSGVFIAIWPVGMPLLLAALLAAAQRPPPSAEAGKRSQGTNGSAAAPKADDDAPSPWPGTSLLAVATAPLSREYEKVSHFWEVLELVRRLVISAGLLAIPSTYGMTRLTIALVSCFLYLILLFTVRPFKRIDDTIVASASNTLLVFTFLTAILIKTFDDIAEDRRGSTSLARRVLGFHSSFDISLTLIFIGFAYVTIVVTIVLLKLKRVAESASVQQGHRNRERVLRAIASKHQLRHPAVFIPYDVLRKLGRLMAHEEVRDTGELRVVDTFEKLVEFTRDEATLFVSHQWLGHTAPDSPDHAQYRALCEACDELCNLKGITPRKLYVWVDFVSIPQANRNLQSLAIESLTVYASSCSYFLVLAPDATHSDTLRQCDQLTYGRRGWCRLEQWAHATGGFTSMFVFGRTRRLELSTQANLLKDAMFVFEGDYTDARDKRRIVDTVLGLWSLVLARKEQFFEVQLLYARINTERQRAFPKEYFGELPALLEKEMSHMGQQLSFADLTFAGRRPSTCVAGGADGAAEASAACDQSTGRPLPAAKSVLGGALQCAELEEAMRKGDALEAKLREARAETTAAHLENAELARKLRGVEAQMGGATAGDAKLALLGDLATYGDHGGTSFGGSTSFGSSALVPLSSSPSARVGCTPWETETLNPADLACEMRLLASLCSVNVASDEAITLAVRWCAQHGAMSVDDVVETEMVEEFVAAIGLKAVPAKKLCAVLQRSATSRMGDLHWRNASAQISAMASRWEPYNGADGSDGRGEDGDGRGARLLPLRGVRDDLADVGHSPHNGQRVNDEGRGLEGWDAASAARGVAAGEPSAAAAQREKEGDDSAAPAREVRATFARCPRSRPQGTKVVVAASMSTSS